MTDETQDLAHVIFSPNPFKVSERRRYPDFNLKEGRRSRSFHASMPSYQATPLVSLVKLAERFGVASVHVKDETRRFGLPAFKVLGASYALARALEDKLSGQGDLSYDRLSWLMRSFDTPPTLVTASDGNHGHGVAWLAQRAGAKARVFLPRGTSEARVALIRKTEAEVTVIEGSYDEAVLAAQEAARQPLHFFLQDTTAPGYEDVPRYVMQGYLTMITEAIEQMGGTMPTHVLLQAGVGTFAASVQAYLRNAFGQPGPQVLIVEPHGSRCFYDSVAVGDRRMHTVEDPATAMESLNCGTPCSIAWPIIRDEADGFISCDDAVGFRGMRIGANPLQGDRKLQLGPSGAIGLGVLAEACADPRRRQLRERIGLDENARVLIFGTEASYDPEAERAAMWA